MKLSWDDTGATSYDLYYATAPGCDIANYASCDGGTLVPNVTSPYTVGSLTNGQNYWFQLESVVASAVAAKGTAAKAVAARDVGQAVSNEVGTRPDRLVPDGAVMAVAHDATGGVTYIGGQFTRLGLNSGYGVPLNQSTGYPGAFPPVSRSAGAGLVYAAAADGAGGYYIGGYFDTVGGASRGNLAHILADGTLDASWTPSASFIVSALAVSGDTVYVGGYFTAITDSLGTQTRNRLAAIDSSGNVTSWDPNASSMVNALAVSGSMVYVGGAFTSFGGGATARNRLAAFDTGSATPDVPTSWDPNADNQIKTLAVSGSTVYAGGYFTSFGGGATTRNRLAAFDTSSLTPDVPTDWDPNANAVVSALAVSGSTVYVGGAFTQIDDGSGAQERANLAAITTDGTLGSWNPAPSNGVSTLAVSGNTIYVGGSFGAVNSESRPYLAAVNDDGTLNSWASAADSAVNVLAVSGSTVYVGGQFTSIDDGGGAQARGYLAALDTNGNLTSWSPSADSAVNAFEISGSTVYVGGTFTSITDSLAGSSTGKSLAAFDATTGVVDATWNPIASYGTGPAVVETLAVSGGTVYVGGTITSITDGTNTLNNTNLAAIGTDGVLDVTNWIPSVDSVVYGIAVSGSTVYVGGAFTAVDDNHGTAQTQDGIAAISTGGLLSSWNPNAGFKVNDLEASDSSVYVGATLLNGGGTQGYYSALDLAP